MPRYEYQCIGCGAGAEYSRPVAERHDETMCGECGAQMHLVPSLTAFALKGGGWTPKSSLAAPPQAKAVKRTGYDMTGDRGL